jgi:hypothetical protein
MFSFSGAISSILALVLFACISPTHAKTLLARATGDVSGATYQLDIEDVWKPTQRHLPPSAKPLREKYPGMISGWELTIRCLGNCPSRISYREELIDSPISAFRLWDGSPDFITIWASGSAYWVRIYRVADGTIRKVLDQATKSAPGFGVTKDGSMDVALNNPDSRIVGSLQAHGVVWKWNGESYQPVAGESEGP